MSKTLAEVLGWEEGAVYRYNNRFLKMKNGFLFTSLTGDDGDWYFDNTTIANDMAYLQKAIKIEPKKYYLKHKFLNEEGLDYLNRNSSTNTVFLSIKRQTPGCQTKFTDIEIKEIEARGFNLCNFEEVEVEDE